MQRFPNFTFEQFLGFPGGSVVTVLTKPVWLHSIVRTIIAMAMSHRFTEAFGHNLLVSFA
jgi:hypothetical protein